MRTVKVISLMVATAFGLGGCAHERNYMLYAQGQAQIESAKYAAEAARYKAMSDIANSGDTAAKVAAVVALAIERGGGNQQGSAQLRAPESLSQTLLPWAGLLVPALTQGFAVYQNVRLGMTQSNNSARIAESTNATFYGMGQQIGAAANAGTQATASTAAAGFTALTSMSGQGTQATANTAAAGFTALTGLANTSNTNLTTVSGMIQTPQPNISYTLTGGGVVGNGTFTSSTQANPTTTTLSGTGVVGAGTLTTQANPTTTTTTTNANPTTTTTTTNANPTTTTTTNANTNTNGTGVQGPITN